MFRDFEKVTLVAVEVFANLGGDSSGSGLQNLAAVICWLAVAGTARERLSVTTRLSRDPFSLCASPQVAVFLQFLPELLKQSHQHNMQMRADKR